MVSVVHRIFMDGEPRAWKDEEYESVNHFELREYFRFKTKVLWEKVILISILHAQFLYGLYLITTGHVKLSTLLFVYATLLLSAFSVTAGAHRLWSHRTYKATWQLRFILMIMNCTTFQNSLYVWVRDHRLHHKHTETDADPHSFARGFFFAHMGWLMLKKHPEVKIKGKGIDMSDLERDEIVMFQKRNYYWMMPLFTLILPTMSTFYLMNESLAVSWYVGTICRYVITLHGTWSVNSFAHYSGGKPYDKSIAATNNRYVSMVSMGEGWHNYHHVFPWDYKTAELGFYRLNWTCGFIEMFAKIGWAYDLKTVPEEMIRKRAERTGDGIPYEYTKCVRPRDQLIATNHHDHENQVWGWEDKDMNRFDKENTLILNQEKTR